MLSGYLRIGLTNEYELVLPKIPLVSSKNQYDLVAENVRKGVFAYSPLRYHIIYEKKRNHLRYSYIAILTSTEI